MLEEEGLLQKAGEVNIAVFLQHTYARVFNFHYYIYYYGLQVTNFVALLISSCFS